MVWLDISGSHQLVCRVALRGSRKIKIWMG